MIRIENASNPLNNSTRDLEFRMCLLRREKYVAVESIFYALVLLKPRNADVIQFWLRLHWLFCLLCGKNYISNLKPERCLGAQWVTPKCNSTNTKDCQENLITVWASSRLHVLAFALTVEFTPSLFCVKNLLGQFYTSTRFSHQPQGLSAAFNQNFSFLLQLQSLKTIPFSPANSHL